MAIEIIDYSDELKEYIKTLNVEWLERYFYVEPSDVTELSNPQEEILDKGGWIYYARYNGKVVGTASLIQVEGDIYELAKMAVTDSAQGLGIGTALMEHCLAVAKEKKISKLILYSNTSLGPAIHLYRKYGFTEVPLAHRHYQRANIKMEVVL